MNSPSDLSDLRYQQNINRPSNIEEQMIKIKLLVEDPAIDKEGKYIFDSLENNDL